MALLKSVSGIRGTIGGVPGENLTPSDLVAFTAAYATWLLSSFASPTVVIGRDGRVSGKHVSTLVCETLRAMGVDVIDTGLSTTPSVEMYVTHKRAQGGIIITASHNPAEWNALKFLNARGEFISQQEGKQILKISEQAQMEYATLDKFGTYRIADDAISHHVNAICALDLVHVEAIRKQQFHVAVDCINSTGALAIPQLLDALGCTYSLINAEVDGVFTHNPEPLASHLAELCKLTVESKAAIGVAVDPDVDRLALVDETGKYYGEEYTLVTIADYILQHTPGPCVSNLSSSQALRDLASKFNQPYTASKVGEVYVVEEMKLAGAVIGGEGNGGVIYPPLHYGRDAMVGIALLLSYLAESGSTMSRLRNGYPKYFMAKEKISIAAGVDIESLFDALAASSTDRTLDRRDGLKMTGKQSWIHLRASNTEPVIRIYAEASSEEKAATLVSDLRSDILRLSRT